MRKNIIQNLAVFLLVCFASLTGLNAQTADFSVNDSSGCGTLTAIFQDQSTPQGSIVSWVWDFGDGTNPSVLQNPVHIYSGVDCYDVTLTVTYSSGGTQTITKPAFVCVHDFPDIAVSAPSINGCSPLLVNLCDASTANGAGPSTWLWDIPNQPLQTDSCLNVVVADPGTYDVTYLVTNSFGCLSDTILNDFITVQATPVVDFTTVTPSSTCNNPPLVLDFLNGTTLNGLSNPQNVTYNWAFPGASSPAPPTSTLSNPTAVTYSAIGNYDVTLIATTNLGCADTLTQIDFVSIGPIVADFNVPATVCVGQAASFTNNSSGGANTFSWDRLCDGTINGTGANHSVTYTATGTYCLRLIAKNPAEGCADTVEKTITVNPVPDADFTVDRTTDCQVPSTFLFDDITAGTGPGFTYSWDFGTTATPSTSNVANSNPISVTFNAGGSKDIELTVENNFGCKNTETKTAFVNIAPPVANFNAVKREGCIPFDVAFTSTATPSVAPYTPYTYEWVVTPAGGVSFAPSNTVPAPTITFADTGKYDVVLIITTPGGCKDTVEKLNYIKTGTPSGADFTLDDDNVCVKQEIQFNCVPTNPLWKYSWDFKYDGTFNSQSTLDAPVYAYTDTGFMTVALIVNNNGCRDTVVKMDTVYVNPPKADFTYTPAISCSVPFSVAFTNTSAVPNSPAMNYLWKFDVGTLNPITSTLFTPPNQNYPPAGTTVYPAIFPVTLVVTDPASGCADSVKRDVTIGQPSSDFTIAVPTVCKGVAASFTNTSQNLGTGGSYAWYFDATNNPNTIGSSAPAPTHVYNAVGNYTVCLVSTDNTGICKDSICHPITITGPIANFSSTDTVGCAPMTSNFTPLITVYPGTTITSYSWNFGHTASGPVNNNSTLQTPSHLFNNIGTFQVKLTVTDSDGCIDDFILPHSTSNPVINFTANDTMVCKNSNVSITPILTGAAYPANFVWDWGNGTQNVTANTVGNVTILQHAYSSTVGSPFTVSVTVTDNNGCVSDTTKIDYIDISEVIADFVASPTYSPCPPLVTNFTNTATSVPAQTSVTTYTWSFGDGTANSTIPNPGHVYSYADSFDVTLIVRNSEGCRDTVVKPDFIIVDGPFGNYSIVPSKICPGDTAKMKIWVKNTQVIQVDPQSANLNVILIPVTNTVGWDTVEIDLPYTIPGIYTPLVKLVQGNCEYIIPALNKKVEVYLPPNAIADPASAQGCKPFTTTFTSQSIPSTGSTITSTTWATSANGTPSTGTGLSFSSTFAASQVDTVNLYVTDNHGCKDTAYSYVTTFNTPNVNFSVSPDSVGCAPITVQFFDQTSGTVPTTWSWTFGDTNGSNLKDPTHTYVNDGFYDVTLTVSDANGCTGTRTKTSYMKLSHPTAAFTVSDSVGCAPFSVVFDGSASFSPNGTIVLYTWEPIANTVIIPFNAPTDTLPYTYPNPGGYDVKLTVTDNKGCTSTLTKNNYIQISTATNPDTILMRRVTVQGMRKVRADYEIYPFADFKQYYLMRYNTPFQVWVKVDSSSNQNTSTMFDSLPDLNAENFSYQYAVIVKNQCDRLSSLARSPKHRTVNASLQTLTDALKVKWNAYGGWGTVLQYDIYRSTGYSYNTNSFAYLATVPGTQLEYTDTATFCLDSAYYRVLAVEQNGNLQQSWSDVTGGIPTHTPPIARMEMVYATVVNDSITEVKWLPYAGYKPLNYVLEKSLDGIVWYEIAQLPLTQQVYVDNDVLVDEMSYHYRIFAQDSCGDKSRLGNVGKTMLLTAELKEDDGVILKWSPYIKWENGVKYYDIEVFDQAFGWKLVTIVAGDVATYTDYKTQIKQGTYCYRIRAHEDKEEEAVSLSNVDCVTFTPRMFLPNAFTPNGDGNNDYFSIGSLNVKSANYTIYDRWGRVVYEGGSINDEWDGNDKGKAVPEGVYMYKIRAIGVDDTPLTYNGSITIIR